MSRSCRPRSAWPRRSRRTRRSPSRSRRRSRSTPRGLLDVDIATFRAKAAAVFDSDDALGGHRRLRREAAAAVPGPLTRPTGTGTGTRQSKRTGTASGPRSYMPMIRAAGRRDRAQVRAAARPACPPRRGSRPGPRACRGRCAHRRRSRGATAPAGRDRSGRASSHRAGSRLAAAEAEVHDRARREGDAPQLGVRGDEPAEHGIGRCPPQATPRPPGRSVAGSFRIAASSSGCCRSAVMVMPICFQVVPDPAASSRKANEMISASVRRFVTPSSSVISASTSTLIRSSRGSARRASTIGWTMRRNSPIPTPSEVTAGADGRALRRSRCRSSR